MSLVPVQVLTDLLRPVLLEHFVHVILLYSAFITYSEERIEPPRKEAGYNQ